MILLNWDMKGKGRDCVWREEEEEEEEEEGKYDSRVRCFIVRSRINTQGRSGKCLQMKVWESCTVSGSRDPSYTLLDSFLPAENNN